MRLMCHMADSPLGRSWNWCTIAFTRLGRGTSRRTRGNMASENTANARRHSASMMSGYVFLHAAYATVTDTAQTIIPRIRTETLDGCHILFSSVIPLDTRPEATEIWKTAHAFGAKCYTELSPRITHVVAAKVSHSPFVVPPDRGHRRSVIPPRSRGPHASAHAVMQTGCV